MFTYSNKKSILRKKYLKERKNFTSEELEECSKAIFDNFLKKFKILGNQNIHIFLTIKKLQEIDTNLFIKYLWKNNCNVFVPKMVNSKIISLKFDITTELVKNSWGIVEPKGTENKCSHFDMVITPLLYSDHLGNRIGYGKGFYDAFFSSINADAQKIGICLFKPNEAIEDVSSEDIPLDYLVTPNEILSFNGLEKKSKK